jgi:hypothetical protein
MSSILTTAKTFRIEMLRDDKATLKQLSTAYAGIQRSLRGRINQVAREIADARDAGDTINKNWLRRNTQYQLLIREVRTQVGQFSRRTNSLIEAKQKAAAQMGVRHAGQMIEAAKNQKSSG